MRLLPTLLGLAAIAHGQYSAPQDESSSTSAPSSGIDCSAQADGNYAGGCFPKYISCVAGIPYAMDCPADLLFDDVQNKCVYPHECGVPATDPAVDTTTVTISTPSTTETSAPSTIVCSQLKDGFYSEGCTEHYTVCTFGVSATAWCPSGLVYDMSTQSCEYPEQCGQIRTPQPTADTTISQDPTTSPKPTNVDTATVSTGHCIDDKVTSLTNCSSEFQRCRCGQWISAVCPGSSVFDEVSGHCLYSLPRCHTDFIPTEASPVSYPAVDTGNEDSQANYAAPTGYQAASNVYLPHWEHDQLLVSNPFFTHKKRHRHGKKHGHSDKVRKMGKLRAASKSVRVDDRVSYVTDDFRGPYEPYVHSRSWSVFPRNRVHGMRMHQADDDFSSDETPVDEQEVTTTTAQSSTESPTPTPPPTVLPFAIGPNGPLVITSDEIEGSGEDDTEESVNRQKRSYGNAGGADSSNDQLCRGVASSTLVSLGPCQQDFIFCRFDGAHRAGCPLGDLYDDTKKSCVPANICGVVDSEICGIIPTVSTPLTTDVRGATPSSDDFMSTCTEGFSGILAPSNCSSTYVVCDNGVEITMSCPDGLFYNNANGRCDSANTTPLCGPVTVTQDYTAASTTPTAENPTPVPYVPVQTTPGVASVAPYVPITSTSSIPPVLSGECDGINTGFVAATPCGTSFLVCSDGKILTRMNCPASLVFNGAVGYCEYPNAVSECSNFVSSVTTPHASIAPEAQEAVTTVRPVTSTVFEQALTGPCGMTDGYIPTERCSNSYVSCIGGRVTATMYCSADLVFNGHLIACVRPEDLDECPESVVVPISTDGYPASSSTIATTATVATTPAYIEPTIQYMQSVAEVTEVSCSAPVSSAKACSPVYTLCSNGVDYEFTCPSPLVFNRDRRVCDFKKFVAECVESVPVTTTTIVTSASTTKTDNIYALPLESTTFGYDGVSEKTTNTVPVESSTYGYEAVTTSVPLPSSTQRQCSFAENVSGISLGFCSSHYALCQADDTLKTVTCDIGLLFDSASSKCVPAAECGRHVKVERPVTTTTTPAPDTRCSKLPSGSGLVAETPCSNFYVSCHQGVATTKHCPDKFVYSESRGLCMRRQRVRECRNIVYLTANSSDHSSFCMGREDNLYRDPRDCAGIIQCHGYELFKHSGCPSGLVFNDRTKACDYRQNVKGCEEKQQHPQKDSGCNGAAHGAYIPSDSDCTVFYRCVWDSLVRMKCPSGTVFNDRLNVCDWPSAVPHCSAETPVRPY